MVSRLLLKVFSFLIFYTQVHSGAVADWPERFSEGPVYRHVMLNKDADRIVYLIDDISGRRLVQRSAHDLSKPPQVVMADIPYPVNSVAWIGPDRLLLGLMTDMRLTLTGKKWPHRRFIAVNLDGSERKGFGFRAIKNFGTYRRDTIIHGLPKDSSHFLVTLPDRKSLRNHVYKVNSFTGDLTMVLEAPSKKIYNWYADAQGHVRLGHGVGRDGNGEIILRKAPDADWISLGEQELFADGRFGVYQFTDNPEKLYVSSSYATGRNALYEFSLKRGRITKTIFKHKTHDVSGLLTFGEDSAVQAAYVLEDRLQVFPLSDAFKAVWQKLTGMFEQPISIVSLNRDMSRLIVLEEGETQFARYYIVDFSEAEATKHFLFDQSPALTNVTPAVTEARNIRTRDGLNMRSYITWPGGARENLPLILLPHGGPFARDYMSNDPWAQVLAKLGYAVLQPNFRGSTGFGHRYYALGIGEWGGEMQLDLIDAVKHMVDQGEVDANRVCIVGASYGGYAAFYAIHDTPDVFRCAASLAGISDVPRLMKDEGFWDDEEYRYWQVIGNQDYGRAREISAIRYAKKLKRPLLIAHGMIDDIVLPNQSTLYMDKVGKYKNASAYVEFLPLEGENHYLKYRRSRQQWLVRLAAFLSEHNPVDTSKVSAEPSGELGE